MKPPPGYLAVEGPGARAFALPEAEPWVREVLGAGLRLRDAAASHPDALTLRGRGPVHAIPGPASGRWVVRPYRRGGFLAAPLLGDRYLRLGAARPLVEARASARARARGVATPHVLAGALYPRGAFYRADLVTEHVPDARELAEALLGSDTAEEDREAALAAAGELLARAALAGLEHPDLNARNVLLRGAPPRPSALLLDLDRCRVLPEGSRVDPARMLARLERSLEKLGRRAGRSLRPAERAALREAARTSP